MGPHSISSLGCMLLLVVTVPPQPPVNAFNITELVFGDKTNYLPAAFGDFNSDKLTDLFVISDDEQTVKVLISHTTPPLLRPDDLHALECTYQSLRIKNLVPGDFDGNGFMDILLVSLNPGVENPYQIFVLWGIAENKSLECGDENSPLLNLSGQPLVMDVNGDMIPDLFGEKNNTRMFWLFGPDRMPPRPIVVDGSTSLPRLKKPSSHAFIDLDGDLAADLWVTTANESYEIWNTVSNKWKINTTILTPEGVDRVGQTSFADVNLTGHVNVLVPACKTAYCTVFLYDFQAVEWIELNISLVDASGNTWTYPPVKGNQYRYSDTVTLRIGDFNLDGYPDFLVTLMDVNEKARVVLMENVPCVEEQANRCSYPRTFTPKFDLFRDYGDTVLGTFCDFQEDGTLDVLLVAKAEDGKYKLQVYKDDLEYDAVFVKVLVLTGRCYVEDCPLHAIPYGTNQPGPSISYSIITATGGTQVSRATQLAQSAHYALQLPYTIFGLGRNWNFVEVMKVGIPPEISGNSSRHHVLAGGSSSTSSTTSFTQIIPNSQLIVIPYPMEQPNRWVSKLFIYPSKTMLMTAGALVGTCLFVAAIIAILHRREQLQDKREKQQDAHKFHFDAM